jgi:hypothetical protein
MWPSAIWQPLGEHCHVLINLDTKNVLSNTSYNLASLVITRQRASILIFLVGLCKDIEGQAPSRLWSLAFPTLGKWFAFKLLYLCMHHNNPLITKRNLRFLKCKHCMAEHPMKNHKQSLVTLLLINDYIGKFYVP